MESMNMRVDSIYSLIDLAVCSIDMMIPKQCGGNVNQFLIQCKNLFFKTLHASSFNGEMDVSILQFSPVGPSASIKASSIQVIYENVVDTMAQSYFSFLPLVPWHLTLSHKG